MSSPLELSGSPPPRRVLVREGVGKARFLPDLSNQVDPLLGWPAALVPEGHLARVVLDLVFQLDLTSLVEQYSSLGRQGMHPGRRLAILVYASLTGVHEASKIERLAQTDAAYRFLSGGQNVSATRLRTFRRENRAFFEDAIAQTVHLAAKRQLLDPTDLATDSMRLRADASTKSIRTLARSEERLDELNNVDVDALDDEARKSHEAKIQKHEEAVQQCKEEGRTSISVTNPMAGLMKFPSGAALPGHRVTIVAAGVRLRFVIAVLIGSAPTDTNLLGPAALAAQAALTSAGITDPLQMAADAGFLGEHDLEFVAEHRADIDILVNDPPQPRRGKSKRKGGFFSKAEFDFRPDGTVLCPAKKLMAGPVKAGGGKLRWRGIGCDACPLRERCTDVSTRIVLVDPGRDRLHEQARARMAQPGADERYRRRIATVEPVFSYIEDTMGYQRASSRFTETVQAEILLKILAYNLYRLFFCASDQVALVEGSFDGRRLHTASVRLMEATDLVALWADQTRDGYSG